jgi:hypothetical protein
MPACAAPACAAGGLAPGASRRICQAGIAADLRDEALGSSASRAAPPASGLGPCKAGAGADGADAGARPTRPARKADCGFFSAGHPLATARALVNAASEPKRKSGFMKQTIKTAAARCWPCRWHDGLRPRDGGRGRADKKPKEGPQPRPASTRSRASRSFRWRSAPKRAPRSASKWP